MQEITIRPTYEELETELAELQGRLKESRRAPKTIIGVCDCLLAVNVFTFLLLVAVGLGWI